MLQPDELIVVPVLCLHDSPVITTIMSLYHFQVSMTGFDSYSLFYKGKKIIS